MEASDFIQLCGIGLDIIGAVFLIRGLRLTDKEALRFALPRYAADTDEKNLRLPAVQKLIRDSKNATIGGCLLIVGFIMQAIGIIS